MVVIVQVYVRIIDIILYRNVCIIFFWNIKPVFFFLLKLLTTLISIIKINLTTLISIVKDKKVDALRSVLVECGSRSH